MYSSEYNADNGHKEEICCFISVFTCDAGIKGRYFHIACIELDVAACKCVAAAACKYGNPPVDQEHGRDDKN